MVIYFLTAVLTSHITLTYCDSRDSIQYDRSGEWDSGTSNEDELMEVAENVVFRPYFNHNTHHGHGVASYSGVPHHHKSPNVASQPYYVPLAQEVISLQNVDHGNIIDPKVQSNLIRRSYASVSGGSHNYHSAAPPAPAPYSGQYYYYTTSKPLSSLNGLSYGQRPTDSGKGSLLKPPILNVKPMPSNNVGYATGHKTGAMPQNCYCLPANMPNVMVHHKTNPVDSYYQDYVKEVIAYYNNYYNQYGKT